MHGSCTSTRFIATGSRPATLPRRRRARPPWSVAVGVADETLNGGSPFVEFPRGGREIEEQLRARQGFCWRWWQRNLNESRCALTSDHVRRSSITTPRSHAVFTSASASGQVFYVPGVALGALPVATPGIFGMIMPFIARCLGGAHCWRRRGSLGGPRIAFGRGGSNLGRPCATRGGPGSVFGFGGVCSVVSRTNDAARQALAARAMRVFVSHASAAVRDRPTTLPHWYGPFGPRRADRRGRLLLGSHGGEETLG